MKPRIFRWKAIGPLLLCFGLLGILWAIFGDLVVRETSEDVAGDVLGTEVDIGFLRILESQASVELGKLQVADPFDPTRNLVEAGQIVFDVDPVPLLEKKLIVDRLVLRDLRFGTTRARPARPASRSGFASQLVGQTREWAKQFQVPLLSLTPVDTLRALVLDPTKLNTLRAAQALTTSADSVKAAFAQGLDRLRLQSLLDSARALSGRLAGANPTKLGLQGTQEAVGSIKSTLDQIGSAREQLGGLEKSAGSGLGLLNQGVAGLDDARQQDYALARGLLKLPGLDAPDIGSALFGPVSIDRFQQALYWAELAQKYLPPGLQPSKQSGPPRLRRAGSTVRFPKKKAYPSFLLREGDLSLGLGGDTTKTGVTVRVTGLTTAPALYGRPATLDGRGTVGGANPIRLQLGGVLNHLGKAPLDSVQGSADGVGLPSFHLPGLPFGVEPGRGSSSLGFVLDGDRIRGRWAIRSTNVVWKADSGRAGTPNSIENAVWQVLSGIPDLSITAQLGGTVSSPRLSLSSNLDQAISGRLKQVFGEQVAKAEARVHAEVDKLVDAKVGPIKQQVAAVQGDIAGRLDGQKKQLDEVQKQLETQLKSLAPGLLPGVKLPEVKLP